MLHGICRMFLGGGVNVSPAQRFEAWGEGGEGIV